MKDRMNYGGASLMSYPVPLHIFLHHSNDFKEITATRFRIGLSSLERLCGSHAGTLEMRLPGIRPAGENRQRWAAGFPRGACMTFVAD